MKEELDDRFGRRLRQSLQDRPGLPPDENLAARAMSRALNPSTAKNADASRRLPRYRLIHRLVTVAAVLLIGFIVFSGYRSLPGGSFYSTSTVDTQAAQTGFNFSGVESSTEFELLLVGGVVLLTAVTALALGKALGRDANSFEWSALYFE